MAVGDGVDDDDDTDDSNASREYGVSPPVLEHHQPEQLSVEPVQAPQPPQSGPSVESPRRGFPNLGSP